MNIEKFVLGPLETNCYVIRSNGECWVVDPGMWAESLMEFLTREDAEPSRILLTHGHGDHIAGIEQIRQSIPEIRICCPADDANMLTDPVANMSGVVAMNLTAPPADELLRPRQTLQCGQSSWKLLDTSGHTPGGVSYYCQDESVVLTGDALFAGGIGRFDIPNASGETLIANIRVNLLSLPDETRVLPGHGPETTIGAERRNNPFLAEGSEKLKL